MTGPITVKGASCNGAMPAFGAQLGDAEVAAVLTHVRSTWGGGAAAVDVTLSGGITTCVPDDGSTA